MYTILLHHRINDSMKFFQRIGFWQAGEQPTARETRIKLFYTIYFTLFLISLIVGAFTSDSIDESIFLVVTAAITVVALTRLLHVVWKKLEIVELLNRICVHSIDDQKQYVVVNERLETFMKFAVVLACTTVVVNVFCAFSVPLIGKERSQVYNIGFPFDWRTNAVVYWIEFVFIFTSVSLGSLSLLVCLLTWYLLLNCSLKYDVLANRLRNMGAIRTEDNDGSITEGSFSEGSFSEESISETEEETLFVRDLIDGIETHKELNEYIQ